MFLQNRGTVFLHWRDDFTIHSIWVDSIFKWNIKWVFVFLRPSNSTIDSKNIWGFHWHEDIIYLQGFVCVLKTPAVMYVWDQCFTNGWNRLVFEDVCLALLILLKEKFMKAVDYHQMRQVFLSEPFHVLTLDLVRTYQDIQAGKTPTALPKVNRKTPQ